MSQTVEMHIIARIRSDFPTKFGIPRQSGLADVPARIVFEPEYRNADALRGIEGFSHLLVPDRAPAQAGRQQAHRRVCDTLAVPAERDRTVLGAA